MSKESNITICAFLGVAVVITAYLMLALSAQPSITVTRCYYQGDLCIFDVEIENTGHGTLSTGAGDFHLIMDGYKYLPSNDRSKTGLTLKRGEKAKGKIVFEIPKRERRVTLKYESLFHGDGEWKRKFEGAD